MIWLTFIKNVEEYNPNKKRKILIAFDDIIAGILCDKNINSIVTELFISLVFITKSYFYVLKNIRLTSTHYFIMRFPNKQELQQITFNHSSDIEFKGFVCYIFASLFLSLKESTCETKKNVFYFTSKALFVLEKIKF